MYLCMHVYACVVCMYLWCMHMYVYSYMHKTMCLLPGNNSVQPESEVRCRSDVTANEQFFINESYQQQNSKGDIPQETTQTGLSQKSQMLVESNTVVMLQQMYMDDINRSANSAYCSVGMKRYLTMCILKYYLISM